jgi:hypothetical protein
MLEQAPGAAAETSKWMVTRDALSNAIATGLPSTTGVGLLLFPNQRTSPNTDGVARPTTNCVNTSAMVPVATLGTTGSQQRTNFGAALTNAKAMGGTPTDDAYTYALNGSMIPAMQVFAGYAPYVVLITDGQPTISLHCIGAGSTSSPVDYAPIENDINALT